MNFKLVSSFFLCLVFFSSCKKHTDNVFLANEATLGFDGYSFCDSLTLLTSTIREDSVKTDSLSNNLVGIINDAEFGQYKSTTFFQLGLSELNKVISGQQLDSAVLFMQYTSPTAYYGDLSSTASFDVYEVNQAMSSSFVYSNQSYTYNPTPIGSFSGKFKLSDSIFMHNLSTNIKIAPSISVKLSNTFATKLMNASAGDLSSNASFAQYMNGLAIVPTASPSPGSGVIAAFNLNAVGTYTRVRLYYNDSLQTDFVLQTDSRRLSTYTVSNQPATITKQKSAGKKTDFDTTYVQAMTGAKTRILIPNLFSIIKDKDKKISVGKAEMIFRPLAGTFSNPFTPPTRMVLFQPDPTTNLNQFVLDYITEVFYGGNYNSTSNEYRFNITRHIQGLFSDYQLKGIDNNRGLFLAIPSDFPVAPSRVILDTRKGIKNFGIEFRLVYTEI